jgi:signal transduction histidine kinase
MFDYSAAPLDSNPHDGKRFDVQRRLAFLEMEEEDGERLRRLAPLFEAHAREFVDRFYRHLYAMPDTASFLQDPALVDRLKQLQLAHLHSMLQADWGEEYVARRRRVGSVHAEKGIEPEFFLGAYQMYLSYYMDHLEVACSGDTCAFVEQMRSLVKAVLLDVGLTLDAYFSRLTDDLRKALDMYWRANAELRQFAQLASHDLKTPLATVANLCEEALDEFRSEMPAEACELIERAKQRSYRMSRMIDELLDATLTQPGADQLAPVALSEVMEDVFDRLNATLAEKNIELVAPPQWPLVLGNRPRLCEAFFNLIANAGKFVNPRTGRIVLSIKQEEEHTTIVVADNGPGVPPEELERIFNPFRRLPRDRNVPGSGLGLYFTKNLIEQQGGQVWAESPPGGGARFCVRLKRP